MGLKTQAALGGLVGGYVQGQKYTRQIEQQKAKLKQEQDIAKGLEAYRGRQLQLQERKLQRALLQDAAEAKARADMQRILQGGTGAEASAAVALPPPRQGLEHVLAPRTMGDVTDTALAEQKIDQFRASPQGQAGLMPPPSQAALVGALIRSGQIAPALEMAEKHADQQQRIALAESLRPLLQQLPVPQRRLLTGMLEAFQRRQLDATALFRALDRSLGLPFTGQAPPSLVQLAFLAAGKGPQAAQARQALAQLPEETRTMTISQLSAIASGLTNATPQQQQQAEAALKRIEKLRGTGVTKRRRTRGQAQHTHPLPPQTDPTATGTMAGQGRFPQTLPKVKSFQRVK